MDVDVHEARIAGQEQRHHRETVAHHRVRIGAADCAHQHLVPDWAAVDEQILAVPVATMKGRQPGVALQTDAVAHRIERESIVGEIGADDLRQAGQPSLRDARIAGRQVESGEVGAAERHPDGRIGHGETTDDLGRGLRLRAVALQELEAGRSGGEKAADLDGRAGPARGRPDRTFHSRLDRDAVAGVARSRPGADVELRDRADRGQRLAPEPQRSDAGEIAVVELGGGMALDRKGQVGRAHAAAVVRDPDQSAAAGLDRDVDPAGTGVEGILDELLDRRGRTLDDLAGRDPVDQDRVQATDRHPRCLRDRRGGRRW